MKQRPRISAEAAQYALPLVEPDQLDLFGFATAQAMGAAKPALRWSVDETVRFPNTQTLDAFFQLCGDPWAENFFVDGPPYAEARRILWSWRDWPRPAMALTGPHFSGKTHLARIWAHFAGAKWVSARNLGDLTPESAGEMAKRPLVVDDADSGHWPLHLFSMFNALRDAGGPVLFVGEGAPAVWPTDSTDLASRFRSLTSVKIGEPDEAQLAKILQSICRKRFIRLSDTVSASLITRTEPCFEALEGLRDGVERLATEDGLEPSLRVIERILAYARGGSVAGGLK